MTCIFNNAQTSKIYHFALLFVSSLVMLLKAILSSQPHYLSVKLELLAFSIVPTPHRSQQNCKYCSLLLKAMRQNSEIQSWKKCTTRTTESQSLW